MPEAAALLRLGGATREEAARAAREGDLGKLQATMSETGEELLDSGDLSQLPALFDALRVPAPALEDCRHDWYTWDGPLAARRWRI